MTLITLPASSSDPRTKPESGIDDPSAAEINRHHHNLPTREPEAQPPLQHQKSIPPEAKAMLPEPNEAERRLEVWGYYLLRPVMQFKPLYLGPEDCKKFGITIVPLQFADGSFSGKRERFLNPLHPKQVEEWLNVIRPWDDEGAKVDYTCRGQPSIDNNNGAAQQLRSCLHSYLSQNGTGQMHHTLFKYFTGWSSFQHEEKCLLKQYDDAYTWDAGNFIRYCQRGTRHLDPEKPHINCFVANKSPLGEGQLCASEIQTIIRLTGIVGTSIAFMKHNIIPITLVSGSGRKVRIVQGIVNFSRVTVEIRMSKIIDMERGIRHPEGVKKNWTNFLTLLGWIIGEPVGDTTGN